MTLLRVGEVARQAGVTTRTLRYYQELGLLQPSGVSPGGNRLYSEDDANRLARILQLRDVMGFDLERIRLILESEDRLAELRREAAAGISQTRRAEMVAEAYQLNRRIRHELDAKLEVLEQYGDELDARAAHYEELADEIGADIGNPTHLEAETKR